MKEEIIIAGFGGQGVLSMGKILAYSGIMQDLEVTWMPSYGPEMRGGTANVCVILSDKKIGKPGGWLIYDPSGITRHPERKDINICSINAIEGAARTGNSKVYNMVVLGALLKVNPLVTLENVEKGLGKCIPARYSSLIPLNKAAIEDGMEHAEIINRA